MQVVDVGLYGDSAIVVDLELGGKPAEFLGNSSIML